MIEMLLMSALFRVVFYGGLSIAGVALAKATEEKHK